MSTAPSSEAEAEADEEREEGLCGLKAAVRRGATPVDVASEEDAENTVVLDAAVVELEENDCGCVAGPPFATRRESRKDLA